NQDKMIVTQARHLWTTSVIAKNFNNHTYMGYARHGLAFVKKMWDSTYGGFFQDVDRSGKPLHLNDKKTAYGNAFAIYGLSAYYHVSKDSTALNLAKETFRWLEEKSHDPLFNGYFQDIARDGKVLQRNNTTPDNSTIGYKDYNSSIHLLEAFTALYSIWPDTLLKKRLFEMYHIVKDTMMNDRHYLDMYFEPNWKHISFSGQDSASIHSHFFMDHVSFGHDIETAYLLLEAALALGIQDNAALHDELRLIVDHSLKGFDTIRGGLFDEGYYFDRSNDIVIIKDSKVWWAQAEALNTLMIFHEFYPDAGYGKLYDKQWNYIKAYIIDSTYGGWYQFGLDTRPDAKKAPKGSAWKATYHDGRALINIYERYAKSITL
ncbi:MAG: AGE family epimerase/isomerase, partial [Chitinophagaceae bacterium]